MLDGSAGRELILRDEAKIELRLMVLAVAS